MEYNAPAKRSYSVLNNTKEIANFKGQNALQQTVDSNRQLSRTDLHRIKSV